MRCLQCNQSPPLPVTSLAYSSANLILLPNTGFWLYIIFGKRDIKSEEEIVPSYFRCLNVVVQFVTNSILRVLVQQLPVIHLVNIFHDFRKLECSSSSSPVENNQHFVRQFSRINFNIIPPFYSRFPKSFKIRILQCYMNYSTLHECCLTVPSQSYLIHLKITS